GLYRVVLASVIMAEAVWAVAHLVGGNTGLQSVLRIAVAGTVGVGVYASMLLLLRAPELDALMAKLGRPRRDAAAQ
ncbi:MAG: hypothetical protein LH616_19375, partial [Ilumatobacteraceae bacterium]|nr:hypothetical protein [Ilumatobacteraceae bacterium]